MDKASQPGKVWLVGVGPGDPELVTVKAVRVLGAVDVWLVDDLVTAEIHAYAGASTCIEPVGKRGGRCSTSQQEILERMLAHALAGRTVARVKGGDPLLFGRGGEEAEFLRHHGIEVEVLNGITSGAAAAQALGIALTHRDCGHGVSFVTAHTARDDSPDWRSLVAGGTTLVIYMGMSRLAAIRDALQEAGMRREMPVAVVMNASRPDQCNWTGTLANLTDALAAGLTSPAIIIVGGVVAHAQATEARSEWHAAPVTCRAETSRLLVS
ncbi:MAG: uroporphyrinogen-III C-methyltransferase [Betaproteobacteria bacterium]|nr:uroporphyrinogen-III C-methyltransferase [Betaproteobacteria bacterium]